MSAIRQLALPFRHAPHYAAEDVLHAPSNAEALAWLQRTAAWPFGRLALWGGASNGKTHLLHLWAGRTGATLHQGPFLQAGWCAGPAAIDDADTADEPALLHLLNAAAEAGHAVLLAGLEPPARWPVRLPDLASRLRATATVELRAPDDATLRALLLRLLSDRQLIVPGAVQDWLLAHLPRTAAAMREAACRLDRAALAAGGRVNRAMAARVADEMEAAEYEGMAELCHRFYDSSAPFAADSSPSGPLLL